MKLVIRLAIAGNFMLNARPKFLSELLPLLPKPLHLVISGESRSGKTVLAQLLAKELGVNCEIWGTPVSPRHLLPFPQYPFLINAPIYASEEIYQDWFENWLNKEFFKVWQKRANYWQNNDCSNLCIIIDELLSSFLRFAPSNPLTRFLMSKSGRSANIVITTQVFELTKKSRWLLDERKISRLESIKQMWLNTYEQKRFNNLNSHFLTIRLGSEAERFVERALKDEKLLWQIKSAKYPCLIKDKAIDLLF